MKASGHNQLTPGTGRLELLCQTAIMQGGERGELSQMIETQTSAVSLPSSNEGDNAKPLPALSSEPGSPSSFPRIIVTSKSKDISNWVPPSFVALKNGKQQSGVPQVPGVKTSRVPGSLHPPIVGTKRLEHGFSDARKSSQASTPISLQGGKRDCSYKDLIRENVQLKIELGDAKKEIAKLKKEMSRANCNISELRSLSGGNKISEIPLADMIDIMQEYGSEVSGQSFQKRKEEPQPASIVRQFRRWNPDFLKYFCRKNGKWVPKLGKAGELQRRQMKREALKEHRRNPPQVSQERKH
jgi:hypothetical protein